MEYEIVWEVIDGYCGGGRPQHIVFDTEDYMEEEEWLKLTEEERQAYVYSSIQEAFKEDISWEMKSIKKSKTEEK